MTENSREPGVPDAGPLEFLLWALRRRRRFRVTGRSMEPVLAEGTDVFVDFSAYAGIMPRPGDVVVARHPFKKSVVLVKRVHAVDEQGRLELTGDNPAESSDSRTLGKVPPCRLLGRVTSRWR